jgi:hypothetical protein
MKLILTRAQLALAGLAAVYLLALHGCYDIVPSGSREGPAVFRLNRLTGSVMGCYEACSTLPEDVPTPKASQP